jgi:hypothetical protein
MRKKRALEENATRFTPPPPKKRGRPKGTKNKPKGGPDLKLVSSREETDDVDLRPELERKLKQKLANTLRIDDSDPYDVEDNGPAGPPASQRLAGIQASPGKPVPDPEPDPVREEPRPDDPPAKIQARTLTRVGVRQQRRVHELHEIYRTLVHGYRMLATLDPTDPDFGYFAGKYLGPKDSLADLARKIAFVNRQLQGDERVAFDMEAHREEDLQPFVPKIGNRRASPLAHVNPYRNGQLGNEPVTPPPPEKERLRIVDDTEHEDKDVAS